MAIEAGVPTFTVLNVVDSGLEATGELVVIYQVSVECCSIEAGSHFVE